MIDDRLCMHYVLDRLEDLIDECNPNEGAAAGLARVIKVYVNLKKNASTI